MCFGDKFTTSPIQYTKIGSSKKKVYTSSKEVLGKIFGPTNSEIFKLFSWQRGLVN